MPRAGGVGMTVNDLSGQFMGGGWTAQCFLTRLKIAWL
jgi:hypothetical protein